MKELVLTILQIRLAVCRLEPDAPVPAWPVCGGFYSITRTADELSVVCDEANIPPGARVEDGWRALKVEGPLDFSLTGILARLAGVLASVKISLFALSTFDTDYILVRETHLRAAAAALREAGYIVRE